MYSTMATDILLLLCTLFRNQCNYNPNAGLVAIWSQENFVQASLHANTHSKNVSCAGLDNCVIYTYSQKPKVLGIR